MKKSKKPPGKENYCWRLLCCLCYAILEAEEGERIPPPRPLRPSQKRALNPTTDQRKIDDSSDAVQKPS